MMNPYIRRAIANIDAVTWTRVRVSSVDIDVIHNHILYATNGNATVNCRGTVLAHNRLVACNSKAIAIAIGCTNRALHHNDLRFFRLHRCFERRISRNCHGIAALATCRTAIQARVTIGNQFLLHRNHNRNRLSHGELARFSRRRIAANRCHSIGILTGLSRHRPRKIHRLFRNIHNCSHTRRETFYYHRVAVFKGKVKIYNCGILRDRLAGISLASLSKIRCRNRIECHIDGLRRRSNGNSLRQIAFFFHNKRIGKSFGILIKYRMKSTIHINIRCSSSHFVYNRLQQITILISRYTICRNCPPHQVKRTITIRIKIPC